MNEDRKRLNDDAADDRQRNIDLILQAMIAKRPSLLREKAATLTETLSSGLFQKDLALIATRFGVDERAVASMAQRLVESQLESDDINVFLTESIREDFALVAKAADESHGVGPVQSVVVSLDVDTAMSSRFNGTSVIAISAALCGQLHTFVTHYVLWLDEGSKPELPAQTLHHLSSLRQTLAGVLPWGNAFVETNDVSQQRRSVELLRAGYRFIAAHEIAHLIDTEERDDKMAKEFFADAIGAFLISRVDLEDARGASVRAIAFVTTLLLNAQYLTKHQKQIDNVDRATLKQRLGRTRDEILMRTQALVGTLHKLDYPVDEYVDAQHSASTFFELVVRSEPQPD